MMMKKIFVTGANGLLGTNLVLQLLEQGYEVKALVRRKENFVYPQLDGVELVEGDLSDVHRLKTQMKHCDVAVHIAALARHHLLRIEDYMPANVQGTRNVIDACLHSGTGRMVYVGTANTFGFGDLQDLGNEQKPMRPPVSRSLYARSKKMAQDLVDAAARDLHVTTISPTFMIGPHDTKPSSGRMVLAVAGKRMAFYPPGGKNFVHAGDVARAIIRSFDLRPSGEKFIVANENMTYKEFFRLVAEEYGRKTLLIPLPRPILSVVGWGGDLVRKAGVPTQVSSVNLKILGIYNYYDNRKAREMLGLAFTPVRQAVREAIDYFRKTGKLA